jgi:hypothetical protein
MSDAIEAACRAYLREWDIDPDFPHAANPRAGVWWKTEIPAITAAIAAYEAAKGGERVTDEMVDAALAAAVRAGWGEGAHHIGPATMRNFLDAGLSAKVKP